MCEQWGWCWWMLLDREGSSTVENTPCQDQVCVQGLEGTPGSHLLQPPAWSRPILIQNLLVWPLPKMTQIDPHLSQVKQGSRVPRVWLLQGWFLCKLAECLVVGVIACLVSASSYAQSRGHICYHTGLIHVLVHLLQYWHNQAYM